MHPQSCDAQTSGYDGFELRKWRPCKDIEGEDQERSARRVLEKQSEIIAGKARQAKKLAASTILIREWLCDKRNLLC